MRITQEVLYSLLFLRAFGRRRRKMLKMALLGRFCLEFIIHWKKLSIIITQYRNLNLNLEILTSNQWKMIKFLMIIVEKKMQQTFSFESSTTLCTYLQLHITEMTEKWRKIGRRLWDKRYIGLKCAENSFPPFFCDEINILLHFFVKRRNMIQIFLRTEIVWKLVFNYYNNYNFDSFLILDIFSLSCAVSKCELWSSSALYQS